MLAMNGTAFATAAADLLEMGQPVDGLALACMDDCASDTWLMPAIVSAHMPWYEMGCEATWLVIQRIEGDTQRPIRHITLPIELVVGGTGVRGTARSKVDRA